MRCRTLHKWETALNFIMITYHRAEASSRIELRMLVVHISIQADLQGCQLP